MSWGYKKISTDDEVLARSFKVVSNSSGIKIYKGSVDRITVMLFVDKNSRRALVSPVSEYGGSFQLSTKNIRENSIEILRTKLGKCCFLSIDKS